MKMKKMAAALMCATMACSCLAVPAFAEDTTVNEASTQQITVGADVVSSFTVVIPKTVTLTKTDGGSGDYTATFDVKAYGDIGDKEVLTVTPDASVTLTGSKASATVTATTDNGKDAAAVTALNEFKRSDASFGSTVETAKTNQHTILAQQLTPGTWSGNMAVNITLTTVA